MAKKKASAKQSADTPKSEGKKVKNAPLSNTAIRFVGFLIAFLGIMFIMSKSAIIANLINVLSVFLILWGLYLVSGSAKKLNRTTSNNKVYLNLCVGLLMIVGGILLIIFGGSLTPYFNIIAGCAIGLYGIMMVIRFLCSEKSRKNTFSIVIGMFTVITGILICLLYVNQIATVANQTCYIVFGSLATLVGCLEIVCY